MLIPNITEWGVYCFFEISTVIYTIDCNIRRITASPFALALKQINNERFMITMDRFEDRIKIKNSLDKIFYEYGIYGNYVMISSDDLARIRLCWT